MQPHHDLISPPNSASAPHSASIIMPATSKASHEVRPINFANARFLALSVEWVKTNPAKFATVLKAYGIPIAGSALAGPLVAMLPFGPFGLAAVALARSFADFYARRTMINSLYTALGIGGVSSVQGQILSLLSFMGLSATYGECFHKLDGS